MCKILASSREHEEHGKYEAAYALLKRYIDSTGFACVVGGVAVEDNDVWGYGCGVTILVARKVCTLARKVCAFPCTPRLMHCPPLTFNTRIYYSVCEMEGRKEGGRALSRGLRVVPQNVRILQGCSR